MSAISKGAIIIFACLCVPIANLAAAQFTADFSLKSAQTPMQAKIFVSGDIYRLESQQGGEQFILIHKEGATYAVNSKLKQYKILKGMAENFANPIAAWKSATKDMQVNLAGEDKLNGYQCKLYEYRYAKESKIVMEAWVADALNFFVKQVFHADDGDAVMLLTNIKETELDPALFAISANYSEAPSGQKTTEKQSPKRQEANTSGENSRAPWGGSYAAGSKVSVALDPEMETKIVISNSIDGESICKFTSQKASKEPKTSTITLKSKSSKEEPFLGFGGIEMVTLKVEKGEVFLTVEQKAGMGKGYAEDKYMHTYGKYKTVGQSFTVDPGHNLAITITSDSPEAVGNIRVFRGSQTDEIETIEFQLKDGEAKSWKYAADKKAASFEVTLTEGAIRLSFRQPDK